MAEDYTPYIGVAGEGHRFGILTCRRCGAAVLMVSDENNTGIHDAWHAEVGQPHVRREAEGEST